MLMFEFHLILILFKNIDLFYRPTLYCCPCVTLQMTNKLKLELESVPVNCRVSYPATDFRLQETFFTGTLVVAVSDISIRKVIGANIFHYITVI